MVNVMNSWPVSSSMGLMMDDTTAESRPPDNSRPMGTSDIIWSFTACVSAARTREVSSVPTYASSSHSGL